MKKILMSVAALFMGWSMVSAQTDLFFSEYIEGTKGNNKALEIYNGTDADIDLSAYTIKQDNNGKGWKYETALTGTLKKGTALVLLHKSSDATLLAAYPDAIKPETDVMNFNGDDAMGLFKGEELIDIIGISGKQEEYGKDVDMKRKCDATAPSATYNVEDWDVVALTAGEFVLSEYDGLGTHCGSAPAEDETAPEISYIVTASKNTTTIEVHFSEKLDKASAETIANYALNNDITVSAAVLDHNVDSTDKTVVLTTTAMTEGTAYELTVNGVKDEAGNATEDLKYAFTFGAIEVNDIAAVLALRDTYANAQQYRIKGEVVVVAHVGKNIYVQDKNCENTKGHSLLLYDQPGTYADKFPAGTVLTKVAGSLTIYNTLFEMQYLADDITANGTAEVVVSKATIKDVYKDVLYHAALVQFSDVEFDKAGETFATGNYRMDDPSGKYMQLHVYATDNIVGEKVPTGKVSVTGYVGVYNGSSQLILRDKSDIVAGSSSANENGAAVKFSAYPTPTSGMLTLDVEENNYNVRVFTVAGVEVMNLKALNGKTQINLEGMAKGIYVVEIATANGTSRAKVVLR
ncbi:MAG: lamin tail domain-containing protein [Bacteroidales bacterium]|nr:lamin tail domain-containing protein [Bacteroidales bacterium]